MPASLRLEGDRNHPPNKVLHYQCSTSIGPNEISLVYAVIFMKITHFTDC